MHTRGNGAINTPIERVRERTSITMGETCMDRNAIEQWTLVSELLDAALDVPSAVRAAWLDQLDPCYAEIKPIVQGLLANEDHLALSGLISPSGARVRAPLTEFAQVESLSSGQLVGAYRLQREIGRGGMAHVWLAERADGSFTRHVALKLPHLHQARSDLIARFTRERNILAPLEHPHIARLYDAGVSAEGLPYLAMEYVEGTPITQYANAQKQDIRGRLKLFLQVLDAVQFAHEHLVIHRDLKPSNILVTPHGEVRLLDFGIAKLLDSDRLTNETELTQMAGRSLTLDYASPEQVQGAPLSTASDVYALGVILYELLSGEKPYQLTLSTPAQLELAIVNTEPMAPSARLLASAQGSARDRAKRQAKALTGDLDTITLKALQKTTAARYGTASELALEIKRYLAYEPIQAKAESQWYALKKFTQRNRWAVAGSVALVASLSVGLVGTLWQAKLAREQTTIAQKAVDEQKAVGTLYLETLTTISGWDAPTFAKKGSVPKMMLDKLKELEGRYEKSLHQKLALLDTVATQLPYMGDLDGGLAVNKQFVAALEASGASPDRMLSARNQGARTLNQAFRYAESEAVLRAALADPSAQLASTSTRAQAADAGLA
jgi:eukaryotic-like serine/threonine-protein kinase